MTHPSDASDLSLASGRNPIWARLTARGLPSRRGRREGCHSLHVGSSSQANVLLTPSSASSMLTVLLGKGQNMITSASNRVPNDCFRRVRTYPRDKFHTTVLRRSPLSPHKREPPNRRVDRRRSPPSSCSLPAQIQEGGIWSEGEGHALLCCSSPQRRSCLFPWCPRVLGAKAPRIRPWSVRGTEGMTARSSEGTPW